MDEKCPNCAHPLINQHESITECPVCGYDLDTAVCSDSPCENHPEDESNFFTIDHEAVYLPSGTSNDAEDPRTDKPEPQGFQLFQIIDKNGWIYLGIGTVLAIVALAVPVLAQLLVVLPILIHEFGHAVSGWLFGYPSLPALDFTYGGGICVHWERHILIIVLVYVIWAAIFYFWGIRNRKRMIISAIAVIGYSVLAFTSAHEVIILFMGHGTELVFAGIFLYRALSGSAVIHSLERPLYAYIGVFIVLDDLRFAYRLFTDETTREWYEAAKGGGHVMDFSRIAEDYLNTDLTTVAVFFLICCLLTPFLAFSFLKWKERIYHFITS